MPFTIDTGFGHWLAGFADGEACFNISPLRNGFWCGFRIALHADDEEILREACRKLGVGNVTVQRNRNRQVAVWYVTDKAGCLKLVEIFEQFPLRAKKRHDFAVWAEAVREWAGVRKGVRHDWTRMAQFNDDLKTLRRAS